MAVPRNRMSNARKNSKRAHHAKVPRQTTVCVNCGLARRPHFACEACGIHYNQPKNTQEAAS